MKKARFFITALLVGLLSTPVNGQTPPIDPYGRDMRAPLILKELDTTPANPTSGLKKIYPKDDGNLYTLDSDGNERAVGSGGVGSLFNYLLNPSFEEKDALTEWTNLNGDAEATETQIIDGRQAICITLDDDSGEILFQRQEPKGDMTGVNIENSLWVKTDAPNLVLASTVGIVVSPGDEQQVVDIPATDKWVQVVATSIGNSDDHLGVRVRATANTSGTLCLDGGYVGVNRNLGTVKQAKLIAKATRTTSHQTISTTDPAKVELNTTNIDLYGELDTTTNYRYTAKADRRLCATAGIYISSFTTNEVFNLSLQKNGTPIRDLQSSMASTIGMSNFSACFDVVAGDYIEMYIDSSSDTSYNVNNHPNNTLEIREYPLDHEQPAAVGKGADLLGTFVDATWDGCPAGSLKADGTAVSRTEYSTLFQRIGTTYGSGDGSTTFNLPDAQALVSRATGTRTVNGRTKTGPTNPGDVQEDAFQGHWHQMNFNGSAGSTTTTADVAGGTLGNGGVRDPITDGTNGTPRTGSETRVSAMGVTRCIYYVSQPQVMITQAVTAEWSGGTTHINTVTTQSGNYTATYKDETIIFTASATLGLPPAASVPGKKYEIVASGSSTFITVDPNASETLCGRSTILVGAAPDSIVIQSDGTNWRGLGGSCVVSRGATIVCSGSSFIGSQTPPFLTSIGNIDGNGGCAITFVSSISGSAPVCNVNWASSGSAISSTTYGVSTGGVTVGCRGSTTGTACSNVTGYLNCVVPR